MVATALERLGLGSVAGGPLALQAEINKRLVELNKELAERSLSEFTRQAWRYVDPAVYRHNWHIDAIGEHLEAVARREIRNGLIVNIPPRRMKSISVNVMFPAWVWAQNPDPFGEGHGKTIRPGTWMGAGVRFLSASYALKLATRDNVKCRRVIDSPWFQANWGERVSFAPDQNTKMYYENVQGGARFATGVDAAVTGEGGDIGIIDDPINVADANSTTKINSVIEWWSESMPTRLNDAKHGVFVIVMQRCNEKDLTGYILSKELGFDHLCLPEKFEPKHPHLSKSTIGFKDPRTKDGELLWPERFGDREYKKLELSLGEYGTAGQLQQRPAPREGGMFKRAWFEIVDAPPARRQRVRRWDLAATTDKNGGDPDWTAGVLLSIDEDGVFYVEHVRRFREDSLEVEKTIKATTTQDGKSVWVRISKDPAQAGKSQINALVRMLRGYKVEGKPEAGKKVARADAPAAQAKARNVKIVRDKEGDRWNEAFLDELCVFPNGSHDDQVDAFTGAFDDILALPAPIGERPLAW